MLLIFGYAVLLGIIYKNTLFGQQGIRQFVFGGGELGTKVLVPGIFNSWLWTTSVMGAVEACVIYGVWGGLAFAFGTGLGVLLFVPMILKFRRACKGDIFVVDFIRRRFGQRTEFIFYVASVTLTVYIIIEQAVGVSALFSAFFGMAFQGVAFWFIMIGVVFVVLAGMKGVILNNLLNFILILLGMLLLVYMALGRGSTGKMLFEIYEGQRGAAVVSPLATGGMLLLQGSVRYGISSAVIGFAQFALDPIYYINVHAAKDEQTVMRSFFIGGVFLWMPFVILSSLFFGYYLFGLGDVVPFDRQVANVFTFGWLSSYGHIIFSAMILAVGFTTVINCSMGIMGLSILRIYPRYANQEAAEVEQIKYGRVITILMGLFCGLIAISLENVSLLNIDIFSGIFFSAPASVFLCGVYGKRAYGDFGVLAFLLGIGAGFGAWVMIRDTGVDWFYGTLLSFFVPIVVLFMGGRIREKG